MASDNITEPTGRSQIAQELALKLKAERALGFSMRRIIRDIANDARTLYAATGRILDTSKFTDEITTTLKQHYRKVSKSVEAQTTSQIIDPEDRETAETASKESVRQFIDTEPQKRANLISDTNQKQLDASFEKSLITAALAGTVLSSKELNKQVSKEASNDFKDKGLNRATNTIAPTETQNAAEGTKHTEQVAVAAAISIILKKEWRTILDGKERDSHHEADGQTVSIIMPFNVGGELLMFPGDTSLGASPGNIINCRCSLVTLVSRRTPQNTSNT